MTVQFERPSDHPHVALVTIDRVERANSLDPPTLRALADAWREIAADDSVRCAVLTGAGDRVFCAGMDMGSTILVSQRLARGEPPGSLWEGRSRRCGFARSACAIQDRRFPPRVRCADGP